MKKKTKAGMTVADYKKIHDMIIALSIDADGYGLFDRISDEDVEKCKWISSEASRKCYTLVTSECEVTNRWPATRLVTARL